MNRFHFACRDLKGAFFQILFPVLQVVLILAILTIQINPAGRRLAMHSRKFAPDGPEVSISGTSLSWLTPEDLPSNKHIEFHIFMHCELFFIFCSPFVKAPCTSILWKQIFLGT